ncbi:MAG: ATP-binding protein, partial [Candidatus Hydrothermia bacterium]
LMGYYNPLKGEYQSTPVLDLVLRAINDQGNPYFLILDEMNIAHVEYYFSDFLSGMESGEPITLHNEEGLDIPKTIRIPPNLFVTGTINLDETTHEISPKVLDRAYLLVLKADWDLYEEKSPLKDDPDLGDTFKELMGKDGLIRRAAEILDESGLGFGYRTAEDIVRCVAKDKKSGFAALDRLFISKILPKIKGSESEKLKNALENLIDLTSELPETSEHLAQMRKDLEEKGFVRFKPI